MEIPQFSSNYVVTTKKVERQNGMGKIIKKTLSNWTFILPFFLLSTGHSERMQIIICLKTDQINHVAQLIPKLLNLYCFINLRNLGNCVTRYCVIFNSWKTAMLDSSMKYIILAKVTECRKVPYKAKVKYCSLGYWGGGRGIQI